jgi:KDO2-lipid IV(A) lauroyltransferase
MPLMSAVGRLLMRTGSLTLRVLPRHMALPAARRIGDACFVFQRSRRRIIESNLARIAATASPRDRRRLARSTCRQWAMAWVDVLRLQSMRREDIIGLIEPGSAAALCQLLNDALSQRRGAVIVSMHLSAFDLFGAYLAAAGWPVTSVAEDIEPKLFELWRKYRSASGLRLLSLRHSAIPLFRALKRGELVAVAADRHLMGPAVSVTFAGGHRRLPTGPAAFALKAGAPMIVACLVREAAGDGYAVFSRRVPLATTDPDEATRHVAAIFSELCQQHPDQWFVMQPDWLAPDDGNDTADAATVACRA